MANNGLKKRQGQPPKKEKPLVPRYMMVFLVVGIALYSDAALLFSDNLTAGGTVAYVFTLAAFLIDLYICFRCGSLTVSDPPPQSRVLHRSIIDLAWIYCLVQVCLGLVFTFLLPAVPFWAVLAVCGLWCAAALVLLRPET